MNQDMAMAIICDNRNRHQVAFSKFRKPPFPRSILCMPVADSERGGNAGPTATIIWLEWVNQGR